VDGRRTSEARAAGADVDSIVTIGPTENAFKALLELCSRQFAPELFRGAVVVDQGSTTPYTLFLYATELHTFDGVTKTSRPLPFLVRHSGGNAFHVDWTSVANLRSIAGVATKPTPGARASANAAATTQVAEEEHLATDAQRRWVTHAREDLDALRARWRSQLSGLAPEQRATVRDKFDADRTRRLADLAKAEQVAAAPPQLIGWVEVQPGAAISEIGYDPDSEKPAIDLVMGRLAAEGFDVDDRQTAGLGYDLFAQHRTTKQQRLVEVKGQLHGLGPVTLESNEWAQAMQRGEEFWLYVVTNCADAPTLSVVVRGPASALTGGPRLIERFQIPVAQLRRFTGDQA
jgi:hypothetical protein